MRSAKTSPTTTPLMRRLPRDVARRHPRPCVPQPWLRINWRGGPWPETNRAPGQLAAARLGAAAGSRYCQEGAPPRARVKLLLAAIDPQRTLSLTHTHIGVTTQLPCTDAGTLALSLAQFHEHPSTTSGFLNGQRHLRRQRTAAPSNPPSTIGTLPAAAIRWRSL